MAHYRKIARTAEHSRTGKAIPKGVISQFEAAEAKKDEDIEKVTTPPNVVSLTTSRSITRPRYDTL